MLILQKTTTDVGKIKKSVHSKIAFIFDVLSKKFDYFCQNLSIFYDEKYC